MIRSVQIGADAETAASSCARGALLLSGFRESDFSRIECAFRLTAGPFEKDGWLAAIA